MLLTEIILSLIARENYWSFWKCLAQSVHLRVLYSLQRKFVHAVKAGSYRRSQPLETQQILSTWIQRKLKLKNSCELLPWYLYILENDFSCESSHVSRIFLFASHMWAWLDSFFPLCPKPSPYLILFVTYISLSL